jgi:dipeptidyl aminopeptidase/acylaminoacyl peptidase
MGCMRYVSRLFRCFVGALVLAIAASNATAADPPPLSAYGELPGFEVAAISPSGQQIAVIGTIEGQRLLLFLDAGMSVQNTANIGDLKVRDLEWIGEDSVLLTTSDTQKLGPEFTTDKYEAIRAMIVPRAPGGKTRMVFTKGRAIVSAVFGDYGIRKVDGAWIGYFGGVALGETTIQTHYLATTQPTLFSVDLVDDSTKRIAPPGIEEVWRDWLVDGAGHVAATFDMNRQTGAWTLNGPGGKTIAEGVNAAGKADLVSLGRDGTTVIYSARYGNETANRWYEVPLDGSRPPVEILHDVLIEGTYVSRTDGRLLGYTRGGAGHARIFLDPKLQQLSDKITRAFPGLELELSDWTPDFSRVLVRTSGTGDSGTWYLVDLGKMTANAIGRERPLISPPLVGPVSTFLYRAADGLSLDGVLTLPPGREAKGLPIVILPHGGPRAYDKAQFDWWAQAFASRGYAVFQPNFRGSTNRDQQFMHAGDGQWGRKMQTDISDGLGALAAKGIVDAHRACIVGASYGGYAALAGVTLQHGIYRCAVSVAGIGDVSQMYKTEVVDSGSEAVVKQALLEQLGERSALDAISPVRFAREADAPILLIHGRDDTVVPFEQSRKMADALKDAGKPYEFVELKGEDHWLSRSDTRDQMLQAAVAFVQKYNPAG